jgi:uncharacterized membrane protein
MLLDAGGFIGRQVLAELPAFLALLAIFWLMIAKPTLWGG